MHTRHCGPLAVPPLLNRIFAECDRCDDTGIWREPSGTIAKCPKIQIGLAHPQPNDASVMLQRAVERLRGLDAAIDSHAFELAKWLTRFDSAHPYKRETMISRHFEWSRDAKRQVAKTVEDLRSVWLLPVGGRKEEPSGYWIITDVDDFAKWVSRAKSAPITQLSTIHRVAKRNFPIFAEQLELDFWKDLGDTEAFDI